MFFCRSYSGEGCCAVRNEGERKDWGRHHSNNRWPLLLPAPFLLAVLNFIRTKLFKSSVKVLDDLITFCEGIWKLMWIFQLKRQVILSLVVVKVRTVLTGNGRYCENCQVLSAITQITPRPVKPSQQSGVLCLVLCVWLGASVYKCPILSSLLLCHTPGPTQSFTSLYLLSPFDIHMGASVYFLLCQLCFFLTASIFIYQQYCWTRKATDQNILLALPLT